LNRSETLKTAIHLFHRQLQPLIIEGEADEDIVSSVLSASIGLDPFQAVGCEELGFLWIAEILNSRYEEEWREEMASQIMESLGKISFHEDSVPFIRMQRTWISSLLGFLSLREKLDRQGEPSLIVLRILAISPRYANFGTSALPILVSPLLPTHPLQSRRLALRVFDTFAPGWFSSQMENVPSEDLNKLVQAVGDPFQSPDPPLQDGKPSDQLYYNPMMVAAVLIGFASSDLWRNHLQRSNFASLEEIVSTWDGKKDALKCMTYRKPPECLFTATGTAMAIRRLEELQCPNTAEVLIMWAWTIGVVDPVDHDGWQLIGHDTLRFCRTRGMERLITLKQYIIDITGQSAHLVLPLVERYGRSKVKDFFGLPVLKLRPHFRRDDTILYLSQACQLRRFYQLFGYDPTTWKDAVAASAGEKSDVSLGHPVAPSLSMDWTCDYP